MQIVKSMNNIVENFAKGSELPTLTLGVLRVEMISRLPSRVSRYPLLNRQVRCTVAKGVIRRGGGLR